MQLQVDGSQKCGGLSDRVSFSQAVRIIYPPYDGYDLQNVAYAVAMATQTRCYYDLKASITYIVRKC